MKFLLATTLLSLTTAFHAPVAFRPASVELAAEIRPKTEKSKDLRFGWDGTTALGGAVEVAKPSRMLDAIRESGETIPEECELFNANLEMDGSDIVFQDVMDLINKYYEVGLIEFKNGDVVNKPGENEGSAIIFSYAAISGLDKESTLKLFGEHYRDTVADPDGDSHQNIRNFMKNGWDGIPFENGVALTKKKLGDDNWDWDAESWIP